MNQNTFCKYCHMIPSQCSCAHPAKTLTDEEIEVLASKHLCYQIEGSEVSGVFNFARAILRKAQEK